MIKKVTLGPLAKRELMQQISYYKENGRKDTALKFIFSIEEAKLTLQDYPQSGKTGQNPNLRYLIVGSYILTYEIFKKEIIVHSIRHCRMKHSKEMLKNYLKENGNDIDFNDEDDGSGGGVAGGPP